MKNLAAILSEFLEEAHQMQLVTFGQAEPPARVDVDTDRLVEQLARQAKFNDRIIVVIVASYLFVLLLSSALVVLHHDNVTWITSFLGGNILVLTSVAAKLQDVWREKSYIDMLLAMLPSLTPAEAVKAIQSFYLEKLKKAAGRPALRERMS